MHYFSQKMFLGLAFLLPVVVSVQGLGCAGAVEDPAASASASELTVPSIFGRVELKGNGINKRSAMTDANALAGTWDMDINLANSYYAGTCGSESEDEFCLNYGNVAEFLDALCAEYGEYAQAFCAAVTADTLEDFIAVNIVRNYRDNRKTYGYDLSPNTTAGNVMEGYYNVPTRLSFFSVGSLEQFLCFGEDEDGIYVPSQCEDASYSIFAAKGAQIITWMDASGKLYGAFLMEFAAGLELDDIPLPLTGAAIVIPFTADKQ